MLDRKALKVNHEYQRQAGVWPPHAQTYFIDTILEEYPFPKLYFYQNFNRADQISFMEVVDGQQRLHAIQNFVSGNLELTNASPKYREKKFKDLTQEDQERFLLSRLSADVIIGAERAQLLEMFRRMNAYNTPLNEAEKRHANYHGAFKWFIQDVSEKYSPTLQAYNILTTKQIVRMDDAEFFSDLILGMCNGATAKSSASINKVYLKFDKEYPDIKKHEEVIDSFFKWFSMYMSELKGTFITKEYVFNSLMLAYSYVAMGVLGGEEVYSKAKGCGLNTDNSKIMEKLRGMVYAHETKEVDGEYGEYVKACLIRTTGKENRLVRLKAMISALAPE